jgi:dGTPase
MEAVSTERAERWVSTMHGTTMGGVVLARSGDPPLRAGERIDRQAREDLEDRLLAPGATRARGAGRRAIAEAPDPLRTCFERDRDRILHNPAFRRLAGKTQVFIFPEDHQRTRLTHALEVAQVATAIARATGLNLALTEATALGHDCGHGPGGHASEDAFTPYLDGGYDHAVWGADVALAGLNLCEETLDGIRNHSWSRPSPSTPEGLVVSWADRIAYSCHDLEDAVLAGIVDLDRLPAAVASRCGTTRSHQLRTFIGSVVDTIQSAGVVGMAAPIAEALGELRAFNYREIYYRPASVDQAASVIRVLRALVDFYIEHPEELPGGDRSSGALRLGPADDRVRSAVTYVAGMTDRFAFAMAVAKLGWDTARLPHGVS